MVFTMPKEKLQRISFGVLVDKWLAGFQPVRNTRAVLSMVSASDDARVSKRA